MAKRDNFPKDVKEVLAKRAGQICSNPSCRANTSSPHPLHGKAVLIGSTLVGLGGREGEVMRQAMPYCLVIVLLVGLEALITSYLFS